MSNITPSGTAYQIAGDGNRNIVLIHGLGLNMHSWQWQIPVLSQKYRIVTYDLFGHGSSCDPPKAPSLKLFADQLVDLLDHLNIKNTSVFGFSLGGMIARRFTMDYSNRVDLLGILHSAHQRNQVAQNEIQSRVLQVRQDGPAATVEAALKRWFTDDFRNSQPQLLDLIRQWILANRKDVYAQIYQVLVDGVTELIEPKPPIVKSTLVMTGEDDYGNSPEMSRAIAAEIKGAELIILPKLRHMAIVEASDLCNNKICDFLDRTHS